MYLKLLTSDRTVATCVSQIVRNLRDKYPSSLSVLIRWSTPVDSLPMQYMAVSRSLGSHGEMGRHEPRRDREKTGKKRDKRSERTIHRLRVSISCPSPPPFLSLALNKSNETLLYIDRELRLVNEIA